MIDEFIKQTAQRDINDKIAIGMSSMASNGNVKIIDHNTMQMELLTKRIELLESKMETTEKLLTKIVEYLKMKDKSTQM